MMNYKRYYLRPNSYDYLALNKVLRTNDAKYGYLQEIEKDGRRYIIASRHRFGSNTVEDVIVGCEYDIERLSQVYFGRVRPFDPLPCAVGRVGNPERLF